MKKILSLLLSLTLLATLFLFPAGAQETIQVTLNGNPIVFDQPPVMQEDRVLVPIRAVCAGLGADVYWYEPEQGIIIIKNEIKLFFAVGQTAFSKILLNDFSAYRKYIETLNFENEAVIHLDVAPKIVNGRTVLPVRAVCEAFGAEVTWNDSINTVEIQCSEEFISDINKDKTFYNELVAWGETQETQWNEKRKEGYRDFDYTVAITISGFTDFEAYVSAREFIEARVGAVEALSNSTTFDLSQDDVIVIIFGYNEGFDLDKFVSMLTAEAPFYITDADKHVILDKSCVTDAKPRWNGQSQSFDIELSLSEAGQAKLAAATEIISAKEDGKNYMSVQLDDKTISSPHVAEKIDTSTLVISGDFKFALPQSYAYLIRTKGAPGPLAVDVELEKNR